MNLFSCNTSAPRTVQYQSRIASRRLVCRTRCESFCGFGMVMKSSRVCRRNRGGSAPSSPVRYRGILRDRVPIPKRRRAPPSGFPVPPVLFKVAPATRIHTTMLAIQHLAPGTRLKLTDGSLAEIRENPRDGTWLIVRRLAPEPGTEDELLIVDDIAEIVPG